MMRILPLLFGASAIIAPVFAQTWTLCNPLNTTCKNDPGFGIDHTFHFNTSETLERSFNITAGKLKYGANGTQFTVAKRGDSPTIQSKFYIFFGSVSVVMRAASGQGIISSIVLQSEDLDEVDWEFMGGNSTYTQSNYFGKGNTTSFDRDEYHPVSTDVRDTFHNYTINWTAEKLEWMIDSKVVRTLMYGEANEGKNYPQTPSTVRLGIWAGGDESLNKYTIEWAGGLTDYSKGPYDMFVQTVQVKDYSSGKEYHWKDRSGSWQSIESIPGNSTAAEAILKAETPSLSMAEKWANTPQATKLAVYGGGGAGAAILAAAIIFVCIRQRRAGRLEREGYNAKVEKEREDNYKEQMELREKGLGGWNNREVANQGDDALGGWGGTHAGAGDTHPVPQLPPSAMQSPTGWGGGNDGGLVHSAGNAYSGGYGGNPNFQSQPPQSYFGGHNTGGYQRY